MKTLKLNENLIILLTILFLPLVGFAQVKGNITKVGEATHIEFTGVNNWDYQLNQLSDKKIQLILPQISKETEEKLKAWNKDLIESFEINKQSVDGKTEIVITLKHNYIESFDYQVDKPSKLIVDFYIDNEKFAKYQEQQEKLQAKNKKKSVKKSVKKTKAIATNYQKMDRKPTSEFIDVGNQTTAKAQNQKTGTYDAADPRFERFQIKDYQISKRAIIASREEVYIRFPILKLKTSYLDEVLKWTPEYIITDGDEKQNKQAQFLKVLFEKKRYASFLKTYDFFVTQYPDSKYKQVLDHMYADIHYQKWQNNKQKFHYDEAVKTYQQLVNRYPESPLNERTELLLNYTELERENSLYSIQKFEEFLKKYPNSDYYDKAKFAIAESYIQLKKYDQANAIYKDIINNPKQNGSEVEATYRLGDIDFYKKNYQAASKLYLEALKKYPSAESKYENLNYNLAESLFWQGNYKKALNRHIKNLQLFPDHDYNAYSLTRIGEILNALGADKEKVMAAYLESHFRFDGHKGAKIARVRMLKEQMTNMKNKQLDKTLQELSEIAKSKDLPKQDEFVNLMIADGLKNRKEYEKAATYLIDYYQKHPTTSNLEFFKKRIVSNIADEMQKNFQQDKFIENLSLNGKYKSTWLKGDDRIDTQFFLAKAFEVAGVYGEAEKIYKNLINKRQSIIGTDEELERSVYENLPSTDSIKLGLANSYFNSRDYSNAYKNLSSISPNKLSTQENIQRLQLVANVLIEQGQIKLALDKMNELIKLWDDEKQLKAEALLQKAKLQNQLHQYASAEKSIRKALGIDSVKEDSYIYTKLNQQLGDSLYFQNKKMSAVESYLIVLNKQPNNASLRYRVGEILFENNDINGAEKIWSQIPAENTMYIKLANEKLNSMEWEKDYKKYIDRIPAMQKGSVE